MKVRLNKNKDEIKQQWSTVLPPTTRITPMGLQCLL